MKNTKRKISIITICIGIFLLFIMGVISLKGLNKTNALEEILDSSNSFESENISLMNNEKITQKIRTSNCYFAPGTKDLYIELMINGRDIDGNTIKINNQNISVATVTVEATPINEMIYNNLEIYIDVADDAVIDSINTVNITYKDTYGVNYSEDIVINIIEPDEKELKVGEIYDVVYEKIQNNITMFIAGWLFDNSSDCVGYKGLNNVIPNYTPMEYDDGSEFVNNKYLGYKVEAKKSGFSVGELHFGGFRNDGSVVYYAKRTNFIIKDNISNNTKLIYTWMDEDGNSVFETVSDKEITEEELLRYFEEQSELKAYEANGEPSEIEENHIVIPVKLKSVVEEEKSIIVTWYDEDKITLLDTNTFKEGETEPIFSKELPTKKADENYSYKFKEWIKQETSLNDDNISYVAEYEKIPIEYGSYVVQHEYYTKNKEGNLILDKIVLDDEVIMEVGSIIDTNSIERKTENYIFSEISESITIEKGVQKIITIKYVKDGEDIENNDIDKKIDTSDKNIWIYVGITVISIVVIITIIVVMKSKKKNT